MNFQDIIDETLKIKKEATIEKVASAPEPTDIEKLATYLDQAATEDDLLDEIGKFAVFLDWTEENFNKLDQQFKEIKERETNND